MQISAANLLLAAQQQPAATRTQAGGNAFAAALGVGTDARQAAKTANAAPFSPPSFDTEPKPAEQQAGPAPSRPSGYAGGAMLGAQLDIRV